MSQFPSAPPPGVYVPPNQTNQQQPQYAYQQPQVPSPYGSPAPGYNPSTSQKPTKAFGQLYNQAVTQGKPMLDKLGKTISSKLGNKQPKQSTPQYLENYQNYQQHQQHGQTPAHQYQQSQSQGYHNQSQQFNPGPQSGYQNSQHSPFAQPNHGTASSGASGHNKYFPQQTPPPPSQHTSQYQQGPRQQLNNPSHTNNSTEQAFNYGAQSPGQFAQGQPPGLPPQTLVGQVSGQQVGVVRVSYPQSQSSPQQQQAANTHHGVHISLGNQGSQQEWAAMTPVPNQYASPVQQHVSPVHQPALPTQQHSQSAAHQNGYSAPQSPDPMNATLPVQQLSAPPPVPTHPNQQQPQQSSDQKQPWALMSPVSPQREHGQFFPPTSSPPPLPSGTQKPASPVPSPQQQQYSQPPPAQHPAQPPTNPTPAPQFSPPEPAPTEFIAELPADLGNLSIVEGSASEQTPSSPSPAAQYQAYRPASEETTSPRSGFAIPRRAVSSSSLPLADPWRIADPVTESPTREFFILADLVFDALDRRFEPRNTGLLEASKISESWKDQQLPVEATELFAYDSYRAFGKIWSLEGVPHFMVPCQPSLMPMWNFQQKNHSRELTIQEAPDLTTAAYPTYMPALNRAGWYKYLFLNSLHQPEELEKMLTTFCADTYKPGVLNQPDIRKRDRNESPALVSRATAINISAVGRVCQEVVAQMQGTSPQDVQQDGSPQDASQGASQPQAIVTRA